MSESRSNAYKFGGKNDKDARRKVRQDEGIKLRKNAREEQMLKRRNITEDHDAKEISLTETPQKRKEQLIEIEEIVEGIKSDDPIAQYQCTQRARKILSRDRHPPIDELITTGVIPFMVGFLQRDENRKLQFEAAWALTNIASGQSHQTGAVVCRGAIPAFVRLLHCDSQEVMEQAIWALGNIAGDSAKYRDQVLEAGITEPIVKMVSTKILSTPFMQNVAWTLSNLCRNKNPPTADHYLLEIVPSLMRLMEKSDKQTLSDTCWALSYITDGANARIQLVLESGITRKLIEILNGVPETVLLTPVLRTLGNIVTGTDEQTQICLELGVLEPFVTLLRHTKANIVKEAAWAISNITAGTQRQIQCVIDAKILEELIRVIEFGDFKAKKEATWALANLTTLGNVRQVFHMIDLGVLPAICQMLFCRDSQILNVVLDAITNILNLADSHGKTAEITLAIEEASGLDALEQLQEHENEEVYKLALKIIDTWYGEEETPESNSETYEFKAPANPSGSFSF